jgi:hypothetical protein
MSNQCSELNRGIGTMQRCELGHLKSRKQEEKMQSHASGTKTSCKGTITSAKCSNALRADVKQGFGDAMGDCRDGVSLPCVGWQEWVRMPEIGATWIKAKIDSGACTSALHAFDIEVFEREGNAYVRFKVHPKQHNLEKMIEAEAKLVDQRHVRSSGGRRSFRPVIQTVLEIRDQKLPIELTLVSRKKMKYRMLIGREALRDRFVIDPGRTFLGGRKKRANPATDLMTNQTESPGM